MALQDILKKIQKETEAKLKKLNEEHREKLKKLEAEYETRKKQAEEEMEKKVKTNVERIHEKTQILAKMEAKNELLKQKRALIEAAFDEAMKKLAEDSEYEETLAGLLKHSPLTGEVEVIPAKGKESQTKKALLRSGKEYRMTDETAEIKGGFVLRSGKIEIDNSFESIIGKELRSELELEIAKVLF